MADENICDPNPRPILSSDPQRNDSGSGTEPKNGGMAVIGYNLLALVIYTLLCAVVKDLGPILDALLLAVHILICIIVGLAARRWVWGLSALIVLLIGFSTCVGILWNINGAL